MMEYLDRFYIGATEISSDEIIGALAIGMALAMACSGLCLLGRSRASNAFPVFCGLIFAVSAISMVVGIGHARYKYFGPPRQAPLARASQNRPPFFNGHPPRHFLGRALLHEADANKDGQLTPEEAAQYVREADSSGRGWVNAQEIDQSRARHDAPPSVGENPPKPTAPGPNPPEPEVSHSL